MESMTEVTSEDLAGVYKDLAETVGVENAYKIYSHFKGLQLMFPLKFYSKTYIMQQICSEYNGKNVHAWQENTVFREQGEADIEGSKR